jgi:Integrase core domain
MDLGCRAERVKFLIRDRADQFTDSFDAVFTAEAIRILASPPQAPRANAICERMIGTLRRELLDRLLIVNEHHLRQVLTEYLRHYNTARPSPCHGPARTGSGSHPATGDRPRRAPDLPKTGPWRAHTRIPHRRLIAHGVTKRRRSPRRSSIRAQQARRVAACAMSSPASQS